MNTEIEKLDNNRVKFSFGVTPKEFNDGLDYAFKQSKNKININGFRKGKITRKIVEAVYGKSFFFRDAVDYVFSEAYPKVLYNENIKVISEPTVDVTEISLENGVEFTVEVAVEPEVSISNYKGITYKPYDTNVSEDDIIKAMESDRDKNARIISITDAPAQIGNTVVIDFEGFIDDQPFEGGYSTNYELVLGSHTFIDNFEDQIVGHNISDEFDVHVNFPEEYGNEELNGKQAKFKIVLKEIKDKILPELDDDFAQDVSDFDTYEEYKNDIKNKLEIQKKSNFENDKKSQIIEKLSDMVTCEIPEIMYENRIDDIISNFKNRLMQQGIPFDIYVSSLGLSEDKLREDVRPEAEKLVKYHLAMNSIVKQENLTPTQDEIDKYNEDMHKKYNLSSDKIDALKKNYSFMIELRNDLTMEKAIEFILNEAVSE